LQVFAENVEIQIVSEFAIKQGEREKYENQGFEYMTVTTYIICFGILFFGAMTKDHDSFKVWTRLVLILPSGNVIRALEY
jgi:Mg2+/citrate symporter